MSEPGGVNGAVSSVDGGNVNVFLFVVMEKQEWKWKVTAMCSHFRDVLLMYCVTFRQAIEQLACKYVCIYRYICVCMCVCIWAYVQCILST